MILKTLRVTLGAIVSLLLGGCLDYDEEMWLNSDFSGRVAMTISVPEELVNGKTGLEKDMSEQGLRRDVERIPGVKIESFESFREAGKVIAKMRISFDNIEKLTRHEQGPVDSSPASMLGAITIREENGKMIFERTLGILPAAKGGGVSKELLTQSLGSLLFSKNYLTYKIHLPGELVTANSQHIIGNERIVEWKYSLAQTMREPPSMRAEWKKSFSVLSLVKWGILAVVGCLAFAWWRKRVR